MVCIGCNPEKTRDVIFKLAIGQRDNEDHLCFKHEKELIEKVRREIE